MSDTNNAAVSIPPGSFDYDDLKGGLGAAARGSKKRYDSAVDKAIEAANKSQHRPQSLGEPGFDVVTRTHEQLGSAETIQVYVGEKAIEPETVDDETSTDGATPSGNEKE